MARWLFVRHGESVANAEGWLAGHVDTPLTELGRDQAVRLRDVLRDVAIDRAYCSDLQRARDTARLALEGRDVPLVIDPRVRERTIGAWEGRPRAELVEIGAMDVLIQFDGQPPGGESQRQLAARMIGFLAEIDADLTTLVVAHGGVLRATLGVLDDVDPHAVGRRRIGNVEIIDRDVPVGTWASLLTTLLRADGGRRTADGR